MLINLEHSFGSCIFVCLTVLFGSSFLLHYFLELNDRSAWTAHNYIDKFEPFWKFEDNVERINEDEVSCEEFIERFEKLYKPVVIEASQVRHHLTGQKHFSIYELIDIWHVHL